MADAYGMVEEDDEVDLDVHLDPVSLSTRMSSSRLTALELAAGEPSKEAELGPLSSGSGGGGGAGMSTAGGDGMHPSAHGSAGSTPAPLLSITSPSSQEYTPSSSSVGDHSTKPLKGPGSANRGTTAVEDVAILVRQDSSPFRPTSMGSNSELLARKGRRRLVWCGRMWLTGTDDLVVPALCSSSLQILRLVVLAVCADAAAGCPIGGSLATAFFTVGFIAGIVALLADGWVTLTSCRGTLQEASRRAVLVPPAVTARMLTLLLELASTALAIAVLVVAGSDSDDAPSHCGTDADAAEDAQMNKVKLWVAAWILALSGCQQVLTAVVALYGTYDPDGKLRMDGTELAATRGFRRTFRRLFCCVGSSDDAMDFLVSALTTFMSEMQQDPPSMGDMLAGLSLVRVYQERVGKLVAMQHPGMAADLAMSKHVGHRILRETPEEGHMLVQGAHFMELAVAVYGWMIYVFTRPATGICTLMHCSCSPCAPSRPRVDASSCFRCNHVALTKHTHGLAMRYGAPDRVEVAYSCFWESVLESPFAVVVDRVRQAVVITIRGTLSLSDALKDTYGQPTPFSALVDSDMLSPQFQGADCCGHFGMIRGAADIRERLLQRGILDELFSNPEFHDYRLVVVGHSLGAGLASILSVLLHKQYKEKLHCYAFSPPGGLVSWPVAVACEPFITSFVLGIDMIPRLSLKSLYHLRDAMVQLAPQCQVHKFSVFQSLVRDDAFAHVFGESIDSPLPTPIGLDAVESPKDVEARESFAAHAQQVSENNPTSATAFLNRSASADDQMGMYPAGRIIHMVRSKVSRRCLVGTREEWVATEANRLYFQNLVVGKRMFLDHMPDRVLAVLQDLAGRTGMEDPVV